MADRHIYRKCPKCGFSNIHHLRYRHAGPDREWLELTCAVCDYQTEIPCVDANEAA